MITLEANPRGRGNILRRKDVPPRYGDSLTSFDRKVRLGLLPKGFKLGPPPTRAVGWYEADLDRAYAQFAAASQEA